MLLVPQGLNQDRGGPGKRVQQALAQVHNYGIFIFGISKQPPDPIP